MQAILIEPVHEQHTARVSLVDVRTGPEGPDLDHMYELLKCSVVQMFEPQNQPLLGGHIAVIDQEGLFKPTPGYLYIPAIHHVPFAGSMLLFGEALTGSGRALVDVKVSLEVMQSLFPNCYCTPAFAAAAHRLAERRVREAHPDWIIVPGSELIAGHKPST